MKIPGVISGTFYRKFLTVLAALVFHGMPQPAMATTLYDDLGGSAGVTAIVDQFLWNLADDARVNHYFVETSLPRFREKLVEYVCQATDGPCVYTGDTMARTHANMAVTIAAFNVAVECLIDAMERNDIATGTQNRLLKVLATTYGDVVQE